jgi:hypothetical protein
MADLSPAAQALLAAYNAGFNRPVAVHHKPRIAAAFRAAVEQSTYQDAWDGQFTSAEKILAIADELDNNATH